MEHRLVKYEQMRFNSSQHKEGPVLKEPTGNECDHTQLSQKAGAIFLLLLVNIRE